MTGHRYFGVVQNPDGTWTFFTRGVDRLTGPLDQLVQSTTGVPFTSADNLWRSFTNAINNFVNQNGGASIRPAPTIHRPDWEKLSDVLYRGRDPYSFTGCTQ